MKCPGQDTQYWTDNAIYDAKCPECGDAVEFFKDDTTRKCSGCGHRFINPRMDFGCASYCQHAEQCLGNLPPELLAERGDLLKDRVAIEMKRYFKSDFKRISHATRVARYADRIGKEEGGNLSVIISAAYLHDIGIHEAEKQYNSTAAKYQEELGPGIAKEILKKLGAIDEMIDEVCDIIGHHHHPRDEETVNFKALYDADLIANIEDNKKDSPIDEKKLEKIIKKSFLTESGGIEAKKVLLV
ncbi:MAG: HD domain-containing protein [Desulfobacterales bacterium]|nr:HD domain-containing protein [Desulfobacterales bacterium]MCP4159830.1 HD domain-containing protein [Deltaproteobacteria bacterium]